jgi:hypothetical protein
MASSQITVSRLLELDVPVSWQEAVAIVAEVEVRRLAAAALGSPAPRIDAESCVLTRRGDILLSTPTETGQSDAEVQLLRALLAGSEMPADLEQVAYGTPPKHLGDALAMFSRPDRRADIAAVAERGLAAEADLELVVTAQAASVPAPPVASPPPPEDAVQLRAEVMKRAATPRAPAPGASSPARRSGFWNRRRAAAAAMVVAGGTALGLWAVAGPAAPPGPDLGMPEALLPTELNDWWHAVGLREGDIQLGRRASAAARATAATGIELTPAGGMDGTGASAAASPLAAGSEPTSAAADTGGVKAAPAATSATSAGLPGEATAVPPPSAPVYSWRSAGIDPPLMTFPRMPQSAFPPPGTAIEGQFIEVLIGESGSVEAVRLRGTPADGAPAYHYSMILAAAKAWQFKPATRDGVPVRYVARVVLEP